MGDQGASSSADAASRTSKYRVPQVPFSGDAKHFSGWYAKMKMTMKMSGHWAYVDPDGTPPGPKQARSVIGGSRSSVNDKDAVKGKDEDDNGSVMSESKAGEPSLQEHERMALEAHATLLTNQQSYEVLALLEDVPDGNGREVLKRLLATFQRSNQANKNLLKSEFLNIKQNVGEPVDAYAARLKHCVLALTAIQEGPSMSDTVYVFTNGLNNEFDQLREMLFMQGPEDLHETVTLALAAESRMKIKAASGRIQGSQRAQEVANFVSNQGAKDGSGQGGTRQKGNPVRGLCWRCAKEGHNKASCPSPAENFKCTHCGKQGHLEIVCSSKANGLPKVSVAGAGMSAVVHHVESGMSAGVTKSPGKSYAQAFATGVVGACVEKTKFWLDSAASSSMCTSAVPLKDATIEHNTKIEVASGEKLTAPSMGTLKLKVPGGDILSLSKVLTHEKLSRNLLSVGTMCDANNSVLFTKDEATVFDSNQKVILRAAREIGGTRMYAVEADVEIANSAAAINRSAEQEASLLHCQLGHLSISSMKKLADAKAVAGLPAKPTVLDLCAGCVQGKGTREPFGRSMTERLKATRKLERVHVDLNGPLPESISGCKYMMLIVDEFTRKVWFFPLVRKADAAARIQTWCRMVTAQQGISIGEFHSDGGGEFVSNELLGFFKASGIHATTNVFNTPQHTGIVERMNRTILEKVLAVLMHANCCPMVWAEVARAIVYVHNRTVLRSGTKEVPEALWRPHPTDKPSIEGLRVLLCDAWVLVPAEKREGKFASKAELGIFVGYDEDRHGYRVLDVVTHQVTVSRDVTFDQEKFTQCDALVAQQGGHGTLKTFREDLERVSFDNEVRFVELISLREHQEAEKRQAKESEATAVEDEQKDMEMPQVDVDQPRADPDADQPSKAKGVRFVFNGVPIAQIEYAGAGKQPSAVVPVSKAPTPAVRFLLGGVPVDEVDPEYKGSRVAAAAPAPSPTGPHSGTRSHHGIQKPAPHRLGMVAEGDLGAEGMSAEVKTTEQHSAYSTVEINDDPASFADAMASDDREHWLKAAKAELASMRKYGVWKRVPLPRGARPIGCKWVFRRKYDKDGNVSRYKARLVAQGFAQREGVDYFDTFAPVLHYKSLRVILALVATLDYVLLQMDVPTAFLNAECKEDVYMKPPPGGLDDEDGAGDDTVCKLIKAIYGIKQAPREWNGNFHNAIIALGYTRCVADPCVYVKVSKTGRVMIIPIFVDDAFPSCHPDDEVELRADLKKLMDKYDIPHCDEAGVVLGMRITRDRKARTLKLDQEIYLMKLVAKHGMLECNPAQTPLEERSSKSNEAEDSSKPEDSRWRDHYGSLVGALLYAALSTRPDIAYAASVMARSVSNPSHGDWLAAKRVLRYIKGTASIGLTFGSAMPCADGVTLAPSFCDADWAGDLHGRRSTTGLILKVNGCTVSWASKKQHTVSLSSAEAEYMAAGAATQEIIWLRGLLSELGFQQREPTVLQVDNQSAIAIASDDVHHARTKHIDIRHHFIRQHIVEGALQLRWVASAEQEADILTKPLGRVLFMKLRERLMGM